MLLRLAVFVASTSSACNPLPVGHRRRMRKQLVYASPTAGKDPDKKLYAGGHSKRTSGNPETASRLPSLGKRLGGLESGLSRTSNGGDVIIKPDCNRRYVVWV